MKTLLLVLLLGLLISIATATEGSISKDLFEEDTNDDAGLTVGDEGEHQAVKKELRRNPCITKKCKRGETCELDKKKKPICVCTPDCSFYAHRDDRYRVCSDKNDTYLTACHLDRDHCLCKRNENGCSHPGTKKIVLEYYGGCQEMKNCTENEAIQFPERMKQWLFVVMEELDRRSKMSEYKDLMVEAREDANHTMAVVWKFCDLDKDPKDRIVSRRELQYTVRTLKALEQCLVPFLDKCDENGDRNISLTEWGECLGMDHDSITDKCPKAANKKKKNKE